MKTTKIAGAVFVALALVLHQLGPSLSAPVAVPPPLPVLPIPTASQLKWQRREVIAFFHFGMNTFTDHEWGTGAESPLLFDPPALNASQWVAAVADAGITLAILTAKHHDGFCLWPSIYTDHSVRSSPWRGGRGDVVREFTHAARAAGIDAGLYLSPWDRHEPTYGRDVPYNEFYMGQLHELLSRYGKVAEIWFDGAKGANATNMTYYFQSWFQTAKQLQASINIFSDAGPDVRWVGDESGAAGTTCWSTINRSRLRIGNASLEGYLNAGDPLGLNWVPPECDVSIRPGWFWHRNESAKPLKQLLDIYYNSVGRNCVLLLNVPPNSTGVVEDGDVRRLREFHTAVHSIFSIDYARGSRLHTSSQRGGDHSGFAAANVLDGNSDTYWAPRSSSIRSGGGAGGHWIELTRPDTSVAVNVIRIEEAIQLGQRIAWHEVYVDGEMVVNATTVGHKRLHRLGIPTAAKTVRVVIRASRGLPLVSAIGLHFDPWLAVAT